MYKSLRRHLSAWSSLFTVHKHSANLAPSLLLCPSRSGERTGPSFREQRAEATALPSIHAWRFRGPSLVMQRDYFKSLCTSALLDPKASGARVIKLGKEASGRKGGGREQMCQQSHGELAGDSRERGYPGASHHISLGFSCSQTPGPTSS